MSFKLFLCIFIIILIAFNLHFDIRDIDKKNITKNNIKIMQSNAFETVCEAENSAECTYTVVTSSGSIVGKSTGPMVQYF